MSVARIVTEPVELEVHAGVPVTVTHGLGRQVAGWLVIWADAPVQLWAATPDADTRQEVTLTPTASARVRVVLL